MASEQERLHLGVPDAAEYAKWQRAYVAAVPIGTDVVDMLAGQPGTYRTLVSGLTDAEASARPAPEEWSVKEVIGHVVDTERVFAYRCICVARGESQTLPGFDQDGYVAQADFNARSLASLLDEFDLLRRANLLAMTSLTPEALARRGAVSSYQQSVRAFFYVMAGHAQHHITSLQQDYGLG